MAIRAMTDVTLMDFFVIIAAFLWLLFRDDDDTTSFS